MTAVYNFDIDIDVSNRSNILQFLEHTPARANNVKHNTGVYLQNIPKDPLKNIALIDHKQAEKEGWFKLDFLNNNVYTGVHDEAHLDSLLSTEPLWELLEHEEVITKLVHLHRHVDLVKQYKPTSIEQLAMLLAIIRPAKRHLQGKSWEEIAETVWVKPNDDTYYYKKAHAIAFAASIVVQLNLLCENI